MSFTQKKKKEKFGWNIKIICRFWQKVSNFIFIFSNAILPLKFVIHKHSVTYLYFILSLVLKVYLLFTAKKRKEKKIKVYLLLQKILNKVIPYIND